MKITVWLRNNDSNQKTLRVDYKLESKDDPKLQRFGFALIKAIESGGTVEGEAPKTKRSAK